MKAACARLLAAWCKIRCEAEIIQIDREIDAIRAWRKVDQLHGRPLWDHDTLRERELDQMRAEYVRRLELIERAGIERRTADNVRAMK